MFPSESFSYPVVPLWICCIASVCLSPQFEDHLHILHWCLHCLQLVTLKNESFLAMQSSVFSLCVSLPLLLFCLPLVDWLFNGGLTLLGCSSVLQHQKSQSGKRNAPYFQDSSRLALRLKGPLVSPNAMDSGHIFLGRNCRGGYEGLCFHSLNTKNAFVD